MTAPPSRAFSCSLAACLYIGGKLRAKNKEAHTAKVNTWDCKSCALLLISCQHQWQKKQNSLSSCTKNKQQKKHQVQFNFHSKKLLFGQELVQEGSTRVWHQNLFQNLYDCIFFHRNTICLMLEELLEIDLD